MTVLAIVGLFTTLALVHHGKDKDKLISELHKLEGQARELRAELEIRRRDQDVKEGQWNQERQNLQRQVREAARNEKMFLAIQEAQGFIEDISRDSGLSFGADQSLQFGDDLVSFEINSVAPIWKRDSRARLRRFCEVVSGQLYKIKSNSRKRAERFFIVQIEGHTDSSRCPGDPHCNWWISSGRAASFLSFMRQPQFCPGGETWALQPVGYADTRPVAWGIQPTRRIAVRLVPNYEGIISAVYSGRQSR